MTKILRIHLSGRMTVERGEVRLGQEDFPGAQGRRVFAYLASRRPDPVSRSELAQALWPSGLPAAWEAAVSSIVSKLRGLLGGLGLDGGETLRSAGGCYELLLPVASWIDHEEAATSIHLAEAALQGDRPEDAYGPSAVAHHIARRPFLPGEEGEWIELKRGKLQAILVRALECRAQVYLWNGEHTLAVEAARDLLALSPFRETGYQLLMRAQAASGNAAEALRSYEECRTLIRDELGVGPSRQTREVMEEVLRSL